jgi:hypothetical protein
MFLLSSFSVCSVVRPTKFLTARLNVSASVIIIITVSLIILLLFSLVFLLLIWVVPQGIIQV